MRNWHGLVSSLRRVRPGGSAGAVGTYLNGAARSWRSGCGAGSPSNAMLVRMLRFLKLIESQDWILVTLAYSQSACFCQCTIIHRKKKKMLRFEARPLGPSAWKREMWPRIRNQIPWARSFPFGISFALSHFPLLLVLRNHASNDQLSGLSHPLPICLWHLTSLSANHLQQCNVHAKTEGPRSNTLQRNPNFIRIYHKAAWFSDSWGAVSQNRCKHMNCGLQMFLNIVLTFFRLLKKVVMWLILLLPLLLSVFAVRSGATFEPTVNSQVTNVKLYHTVCIIYI